MQNNQDLEHAQHRLRFAQRRYRQAIAKPESEIALDSVVDALRRWEDARTEYAKVARSL